MRCPAIHDVAASPAAAPQRRSTVRTVVVGHVDHGKSTLIGRLLADAGALPDGKLEAVAEMCRARGMPFEWAFVTDALRAERDQGITIETSHVRFRGRARDHVLLDAPGHREFIRNMVTGAAASDAGLLVVDAAEGIRDQARRHAALLALLGHRQVAVAVNKMDLVGHDAGRFAALTEEIASLLASLGLAAASVVPTDARAGVNVVRRGEPLSWYAGPTLLETLERFQSSAPARGLPLRLPIQDVYKFDERRILVGRIESGTLAVGDEILFSPSGKTGRVASLEGWPAPDDPPSSAAAGQSIGFTLTEQIFVERGEVASRADAPPPLTDVLAARVFWLGEEPLRVGTACRMRSGPAETEAVVDRIEGAVDLLAEADRAGAQSSTDALPRDWTAKIVLRLRRRIALDDHRFGPTAGRIALYQGGSPAGGGLVDLSDYPDQRPTRRSTNVTPVAHRVDAVMRARRNGHVGGVLWFTGFSGAGKSTLAVAVEHRLHEIGYSAYLLDGDNLRNGLTADLGFAPADRAENIRRVGEVAAILANAGMIAIAALISPYRAERAKARAAAGPHPFLEIHVAADLAVCEARDPKGLYRRARAGLIAGFTGVSAPYEAPDAPEIRVDTGAEKVDACVEAIVDRVRAAIPLGRGDRALRAFAVFPSDDSRPDKRRKEPKTNDVAQEPVSIEDGASPQ